MILRIVSIISICICFFSCQQNEPQPKRWLGDIHFDKKKGDNADFLICNGENAIYQYFNIGDNVEIEGDKPRLIKIFKDNFDTKNIEKESGLIRIRFIVNCNGESDRFRILGSDLNYKPKKFNRAISDQLLKITKSITGWKTKFDDSGPVDYYQYLVFKILDGNIVKILP